MNHTNYKKWLQEKLIRNQVQLLWSTVRRSTMYRSTGTQPATPEKLKCCPGWISMVYGTPPT
jgi:hypothetical protein